MVAFKVKNGVGVAGSEREPAVYVVGGMRDLIRYLFTCGFLFGLGVYGFVHTQKLCGIGKLNLSCLGIPDYYALARIPGVHSGPVIIHGDRAVDDIHLAVIYLHGGRLYHPCLAVDAAVNHGLALFDAAFYIVAHPLYHAVIHCLGIDIVSCDFPEVRV